MRRGQVHGCRLSESRTQQVIAIQLMKEELFYSRSDNSENYTSEELKTMIWRYYMSYRVNRRICTANAGLPPAVKRRLYYEPVKLAV